MKTKSIWGNPPKRLYKLLNIGISEWGKKYEACIVGCSDGKFLMPFARKGIKVTGYDIDDVALNGGYKDFPIVDKKIIYKYSDNFKSREFRLEKKRVYGIKERVAIENVNKYATIEKKDFYREKNDKKFDIVFTSCSLHYSVNKDFSLKEKTEKLQSIVNVGGYLYIDYMMAIKEDDEINYPKSKFYRKNEIKNYFGENWEIISFRENHKPTFECAHVDCVRDHFHRFGYILARRLR